MADRFSGTIMVEGGEVFLGTLEQFEENFFANADPAAIIAWADDHKWNVRFFDTDPASAFTTAVMSAVGSRVDLSMVDKEDIILTVHSGIPSMFREGSCGTGLREEYLMFARLIGAMFALLVLVFSYTAIAFFWALRFWPHWLPWPGQNRK